MSMHPAGGMDYDSDGHNYIGHDYIGGMDYDSDGLLRAEWPSSGHYEVTPMLWITMHWTAFIKPGWRALPCADEVKATGRCALKGVATMPHSLRRTRRTSLLLCMHSRTRLRSVSGTIFAQLPIYL